MAIQKIQTRLESEALEERPKELIKNDYSKTNEYSSSHQDALATGDPQGKGTGSGGHTHTIPGETKSKTKFDYQIDTSTTSGPNGTGPGGQYDIEGRNGVGGRRYLMNISKYNEDHPYGADMIDTSANVADGQVVIK